MANIMEKKRKQTKFKNITINVRKWFFLTFSDCTLPWKCVKSSPLANLTTNINCKRTLQLNNLHEIN